MKTALLRKATFASFSAAVIAFTPLSGAEVKQPQPSTAPSPPAAAQDKPLPLKEYLSPWKDAIDRTRRDVILIDLTPGTDAPWRSKVGGAPYLPAGSALPRDDSGKPMYLLAQINFGELPRLPDYPASGMLQFFIAADDFYGANISSDMSEVALMKQRNFRVIYHTSVLKVAGKLRAAPTPAGSADLPFDPSITLLMKFTRSSETINTHDGGFEAAFGAPFYTFAERLAQKHNVKEETLTDALCDYLGPYDFRHKIGGYPSFAQGDPRNEQSSLRLLFQLSSEDADATRIMWGDSGVATFFIDPADLRKADFSRVMYSWDCY